MSPHKITRMSQHLEQTPGHEMNYHANIWPYVIPNPIFEGIHGSNLSLNQWKDPPIQNLLCVISQMEQWGISMRVPKRFTVSSCCFHIPHRKIRVSNWNQWQFSLIIVAHPVKSCHPTVCPLFSQLFSSWKISIFPVLPCSIQAATFEIIKLATRALSCYLN